MVDVLSGGLPGGLVGLIVGRWHHARRIAEADAFQDLQAAQAEAAETAMERDAKQAARRRAQPGQDDEGGPPAA